MLAPCETLEIQHPTKTKKILLSLSLRFINENSSTIDKQIYGMSEGGKAQNRSGKEHAVCRVGVKTLVLNWVVSVGLTVLVRVRGKS